MAKGKVRVIRTLPSLPAGGFVCQRRFTGIPAAATIEAVTAGQGAQTSAERGRLSLALLGRFLATFGVIGAVMVVYFLLRGAIPDRPSYARDVTDVLIKIEKAIGLFQERRLQRWTTDGHFGSEIANFTYAYLHFPALIFCGAVLWYRRPARFVWLRNTLFVSMVIGLVFYLVVPAAPPRLMPGYGFRDTVFGGDTSVEYPQGPFLNNFAAIPSFHFGWMLFASVMLWQAAPGAWWARIGAILLTLVMTWASAATANHFFIDMIIGGLVMGVAAAIAWWLGKRWPHLAPLGMVAPPGRKVTDG
jgi:hypothetical protein